MPRQQRAHGRPGTRVLPIDWQSGHAPVLATTLPSRVTIGPAHGAQVWDRDAKRTVAAPGSVVYDGPARLNLVGDRMGGRSRQADAAGEVVDVAQYAVALDIAVPGADLVEIGHRLIVVAPAEGDPRPAADQDDPTLWGRTLWVASIVRDSQRFARQISARLEL